MFLNLRREKLKESCKRSVRQQRKLKEKNGIEDSQLNTLSEEEKRWFSDQKDREDFYMQGAELHLSARRNFEAEIGWKNEVLGPELMQKRRFVKIQSPPVQQVCLMKAVSPLKVSEVSIPSPPIQQSH